jgi:hypothetical protein
VLGSTNWLEESVFEEMSMNRGATGYA